MTKQEKLAVKSSLLSIKDSLFRDAWEDIVADHPYLEQQDDDIEDDVLAILQTSQDEKWIIGKRKITHRAASVDHVQLSGLVESIADMWGVSSIQRLNGCAIGSECGLGFYVTASNTFIYVDGSINGNIVITNGDKDEAAYLRQIGYRNLIELWDKYTINNQ